MTVRIHSVVPAYAGRRIPAALGMPQMTLADSKLPITLSAAMEWHDGGEFARGDYRGAWSGKRSSPRYTHSRLCERSAPGDEATRQPSSGRDDMAGHRPSGESGLAPNRVQSLATVTRHEYTTIGIMASTADTIPRHATPNARPQPQTNDNCPLRRSPAGCYIVRRCRSGLRRATHPCPAQAIRNATECNQMQPN